MKRKKIAVSVLGASGMVGSSIIRNLNQKGYKNILYEDKSSLNLLNFNAVEEWFEIQKPEVDEIYCF